MAQKRTDLALEAHELWKEQADRATRLAGVRAVEGSREGFQTNVVTVLTDQGAQALGKPKGTYVTLELDGLRRREEDAFARAVRAVAGELAPMLPERGDALVVGLGNRAITPDLIGPLAVDHTLVTRHLVAQLPEHFGSLRPVAALAAGVLATTGVESGQLIQAVAGQLHPACVIAIDALAARSLPRLCRTVQISDTGIIPGSGVGNHRMALDQATLGAPVIAVGVPTVVDGATLISDLLGREAGRDLPGGDLFVTPRDIDQQVADMSRAIGYGVSLALNPELTVDELVMLLE